jgi:hypothetical protein
MRLAALTLFAAGAALAVEPAVFRSYFLTAAHSKDAIPASLTDSETRELATIAASYETKAQALSTAPFVFEARLRAIESPQEDSAAWLDRQLKELDVRRTRLLLEHIQQARSALGAARFEAVEQHVEAWHKAVTAPPAGPFPKAAAPKK